MSSPLNPLDQTLKTLWETKAGDALRRVGLGSVRTTILTLAVLATLIPSLVTGWLSYSRNRRFIEANLTQQLAGSSRQSAREVGLWLKSFLGDLKVFATSYEVTENLQRGGATRRLADYLRSVNARFPDIHELIVIDPTGRPVAQTGRASGPLDLGEDWQRKLREGDAALGAPRRTGSDSTATMEVAVPITSPTGRLLGGLVARLDFTGVIPQLQEVVAGPSGRIVLVRQDGQGIAYVGGNFRSLPPSVIRDLENADGGSVGYTPPGDVPVIGVLGEVPGTDWKTVASIPASTAFADIRSLRNTTILLVLVLLLVVGTLAYGLGLLVVLPLERLSHAANQVAGGDLGVEVPVSGGGEVSQLSGVFNGMVQQLRKGRTELERLSVTDELTGLSNRRHLDGELEREVERHRRHRRAFAVLLLDIDRFKALNDTHGHPAGDEALRQFAQVLKESARAGDTVARFGGEEFVLILPESGAEGALKLAERIRATTEGRKFVIGEHGTTVPITVSIGLARFPDHAESAATLIEAADQALYRSKEGGRNRVTSAG